ncbi:hypothetical protein FRC12_001757 [Ceratobasidium sp. 428]|nr:hypothetical protein FRC12_001757 [Ceratobasidium sp. 428]
MLYDPPPGPPPLPALDEDEVLQNFELRLASAIANLRNRSQLQSSGEPDATITACVLLLYNAAVESSTYPPSVLLMPLVGGVQKQLQYSTCPYAFGPLFYSWAELVPKIQALLGYQRDELERIIYSGTPALLPPAIPNPAYSLSGYLVPSPARMIAGALYILAQRTMACRLHRTHSVLSINTSSPGVTPMTMAPTEGISHPVQHPSPWSGLGGSVLGYSRAASQTEPYGPLASYSPARSTESTAMISPVVSPGSTNDMGIFIGGFLAPSGRGVTLPAPGSTLHMPFLPHFNSHNPFSMDDQWNRYTPAGPNYTTTPPYHPASPTHPIATVISTRTSKSEVIGELQAHGCKDLTQSLNLSSLIPISRGGYGEVYSGTLLDGTRIAVKIMFSHDQYEESKHLKHTAREVHTWSKCDHPNVARLMGLADLRGQLAMVSRWMANGNIRDYVNENPHVNRLKLCTQVADGLDYLHRTCIVHGGLKGPDILIDNEGTPILIDFGNAVQSNSTLQFTSDGTVMGLTMRWAAPELFDDYEVSVEADVYALGMTILEVFTGKVPYHYLKRDPAIVKAVLSDKRIPDRPPEIPEDTTWGDMLWRILVNCWAYKPSERPMTCGVYSALLECPSSSVPGSIGSHMSIQAFFGVLSNYGCQNLTNKLDQTSLNGPLSSGGYGEVYSGSLEGGIEVAAKKIFFPGAGGDESKQKFLTCVARELHAWSECSHQNVASLLGVAELSNQIAVLSIWMENGDLRAYVNKNPQANRMALCTQIADGLRYLHSIHIVHGRLKASNVLISGNGDPVLIDFGIATQSCADLQFTNNETCLAKALRWRAPELFDGGDLTNEADVYALGMTILEAFTGKEPYYYIEDSAAIAIRAGAYKKIPNRPVEIPEDRLSPDMLWELLVDCWSHEASQRPTASSIHRSLRILPHDGFTFPHSRDQELKLPSNPPDLIKSQSMSTQEVVEYLSRHGGRILTSKLTLYGGPILGGFGEVRMGSLEDGTKVAVKKMLARNDPDSEKLKVLKHAAREIYVWSQCNHRNVARLIGLVELDGQIVMVSPWMENGNLRTYVNKYPQVDRMKLCIDMADGLAYLHRTGLIHGDLKGLNVLISEDEVAVITDFGNTVLREASLGFTSTTSSQSYTLRWAVKCVICPINVMYID